MQNPSHPRHLFLVLPCFNEEEGLIHFWKELSTELEAISAKENLVAIPIFVDDGSTDQTWKKITELKAGKNQEVAAIRFIQNYGHQAAIQAGCEFVSRHSSFAKDSLIVVMDSDGQHPIDRLAEIVSGLKSGKRHIQMLREESAGSLYKKITSKWFYRCFRFLSGLSLPDGAADFRAFQGAVLINYLKFTESGRFNRGLFHLAEPPVFVPYQVKERTHGVSKYNLSKMLRLAFFGITSFSNRPLVLISLFATLFGFLVCLSYMALELYRHSLGIPFQPGWFTIIACISFWGMVLSFCILLSSIYLARVFDETKKRPLYLTREEVSGKNS